MKAQFSFTRVMVAGISATIIMTLFAYVGGIMNIKMDVPSMLASMFRRLLLVRGECIL